MKIKFYNDWDKRSHYRPMVVRMHKSKNYWPNSLDVFFCLFHRRLLVDVKW
jgi:hypothetical protein